MYEELTIAELTSEARRIFQEGKNPKGEIGESWHDLAGILTVLHNRKPDVEVFKKWCAEIGIFWRVAYDLLRLRKCFIQHDIQPPPGISWKILSVAQPALTWRSQAEIFTQCRKMTIKEMAAFVKIYPKD